jgi:branched-chain amino acid transport system ATP-binding protein
MLLQVQNLSVFYGSIRALDDVALTVNQGEIVTLIGSNGAGKTTLLRTLSGLLRPRSGSITFSNTDVTELRPDQIVRLGLSHSPEGRQIFATLTVAENLALGAYQRTDQAEIKRNLDRNYALFPILAERRHQRAGTLSGGEQQMLAIARALMQQPRLLLLDEPSLGLAPLVTRKIFDVIRQLNKDQGTTIFLVEQNAHLALNLAHRAYVLQTGRIIMSDEARKLAENEEVKKAYLGG